MKPICVSALQRAWRVVLEFLCAAMLVFDAGWCILVASNDWIGTHWNIGAWIFVPSVLLTLLGTLTLVAEGNKIPLARGRGVPTFVAGYVKSAPKWLLIVQGLFFVLGIALVAYLYSIGAANVEFHIIGGRYAVVSDGGTRFVGVAEYTRMLVANIQYSPLGASLLFTSVALTWLLAEEARLRSLDSPGIDGVAQSSRGESG